MVRESHAVPMTMKIKHKTVSSPSAESKLNRVQVNGLLVGREGYNIIQSWDDIYYYYYYHYKLFG